MKNQARKYQSKTSVLILTAYIFLNLSNIFHHHHHEFKSNPCIAINSEYDSLQISSTGGQCSVHQNYNSIHTLTFPKSLISIGAIKSANQNLTLSTDHFLSESFYSSNQLRAPPQVS